jgi:hypothetical protein
MNQPKQSILTGVINQETPLNIDLEINNEKQTVKQVRGGAGRGDTCGRGEGGWRR